MIPRTRAIRRACAALVLAAFSARAQPPSTARPHAGKQTSDTSLQFAPWFSLEPAGAGLIRAPGAARPLDLAARQQDDNNIIVYGRHKAVDPRSDREHDYSAPGWSDYVMPRDLPIGPASSCSSGAYRTIGGQPATGMDLVGGLGGGRC